MGDAPLGREPGAPAMTMAVRASEAWKAAEDVLRAVTGRNELAGQALLTEARRVDAVDMASTHALVALREWVERTLAPGSAAQMLTLAPTEAEKNVAREALSALSLAAGAGAPATETSTFAPSTPTAPDVIPPPAANKWAQPTNQASSYSPPPAAAASARPAAAQRPAEVSYGAPGAVGVHTEPAKNQRQSALIVAAIALIIVVVGVGAWFITRQMSGTSSPVEQGVAAYGRGSKEAARLAFVQALEKNPEDVRALTYLGRISRELGNLATSRKYLENAIRLEPGNAVALREFASALLADQQPELARRFYVRALEADPNDRVSQGFLGCALLKLNRTDEAARWIERAGSGDWSGCNAGTVATPASKD